MRRFAVIFCGLLLLGRTAHAAGDPSPLPVRSVELANITVSGSTSPSLATAPDGTVWLSWIELTAGGGHALRCASLDVAAQRWGAPLTVAGGADWLVNAADPPSLAIGPGDRLIAVWSVKNSGAASTGHHDMAYHAVVSRSVDGGLTWSAPVSLTRESDSTEFATLQSLGAGRVLAVWLDGRLRADGHGTRLYARLLGPEFAAQPDTLVDPMVCDCCRIAGTVFPDGSALLAYRGRTADEVRDIQVVRYRDGQWAAGHALNHDDWHIAGCPVNGPQLASAGGRAAAAWFTAAGNEPQVLASSSPDAGARFLLPLRVDHGHPLGHVDTLMLRDGSMLVTWLENSGGPQPAGLWLRRIAPNFTLGQAVRLAAAPVAGFPRMALVKDYDATPAQIAVVFAPGGEPSSLRTLLVTLPDLSTLAGRKPCVPCDENDASAARGYPIKGRIADIFPARATLLVQHEEIPGVMRAMTMEFHADPEVLVAATKGRELFGRIERRGREWWIFNVKLLGER